MGIVLLVGRPIYLVRSGGGNNNTLTYDINDLKKFVQSSKGEAFTGKKFEAFATDTIVALKQQKKAITAQNLRAPYN